VNWQKNLQASVVVLIGTLTGSVANAAVIPASPLGLAAVAASSSEITLTWYDMTRYETGYSIERSVRATDGFLSVATLAVNAVSYSDRGLSGGTTSYYRVRASGQEGLYGAYSNTASATTPGSGAVVNRPPVANAGPDQITQTLVSLSFSGAGSSDPDGRVTAYAWSFGDGTTGAGASVAHAYRSAGTYTATLTVTDDAGARASNSAVVTVTDASGGNPEPPADSGELTWVRGFGGSLYDESRSIAVDGGGNIVVAGRFKGSGDFGGGLLASAAYLDVFVAKYSAAGQHLWSQRFGGVGDDIATAVAIDRGGNILMAGSFAGTVDFGGGPLTSAGESDIFVAKYSPAGVHLWSRRFGGAGLDMADAVAVDAGDNLFVTGRIVYGADFGGGLLTTGWRASSNAFLAKLSPIGAHRWSTVFRGNADGGGSGLAVDPVGDVFVTGFFNGIADFGGGPLSNVDPWYPDIFLVKLSGGTGAHQWSQRFGGSHEDRGIAVAVDARGYVVLAAVVTERGVDFGGGSLPSALRMDIALAKFSPAGTHVWSKLIGGVQSDAPRAVAINARGEIIVVGYFMETVAVGADVLVSQARTVDIFTAAFSAVGAPLWAEGIGGGSWEEAADVAIGPTGAMLVSGYFRGTVDFGVRALTSRGSADAFVFSVGP
jgi:PKD repeat protein